MRLCYMATAAVHSKAVGSVVTNLLFRLTYSFCNKALVSLHILRHSTKIACAGSNKIEICEPFLRAAKVLTSLHQQPQQACATIVALHQCFKNCSQCDVRKIFNKTIASLPINKKVESGNRFLDVISWEYDKSMLRHAHFPPFRHS